MPGGANVWTESEDFMMNVKGHREGAKFLATGLLTAGFDVCYSYRPLHLQGIGHAFLNSVAYLDYHRKGFNHPLVCFSITPPKGGGPSCDALCAAKDAVASA